MRVVGLDGGSRRVGVALSDDMGLTAQPLATIERRSDRQMIDDLRSLLASRDVSRAVIGLPLRLDGTEGGAARKARKLAALVEKGLQLPVELWDERLTSVQAERVLIEAGVGRKQRKGPTDRIAAAILLQSWLDARGGSPEGEEP